MNLLRRQWLPFPIWFTKRFQSNLFSFFEMFLDSWNIKTESTQCSGYVDFASMVFLFHSIWRFPGEGLKSELQLPAYTTVTATSYPCCFCDLPTAHGNAGSLTHWARPGIEPTTSWFLVGFVSAVPQRELRISYCSNRLSFSFGSLSHFLF